MEEKTRLKKALNALEYEVSRSSDEVISHQKELAASKESIKDLKRSTDEALKLQRETFSENERLTSAVKSRDETIGDLKTTIDGHVNNEKCLREEVDRLMTLWKLSQSDATAKSQQLADFKSKLDIAEKQIIELSAAQDLANQTREQVDSLKVTMEEAEKVAEAALLSTYEAWNEERTSLKKQMEESQAQREREMREAVNEMRKVNEDIRCKLEIKESANTQLATTVKRLEDEVQSERRNSTDRVRRLEAEVENERRRSMDVVRRMEEQIEGERRKSNDLRRGLEEQIATERRNSGEVTRRMEVVEKEKKGFGVNLARVAELQAALLAKGTELQKLSAHIDELEESKKLAAVQVDRELNELRSQLQARTEEIEYLKKEVESKSSVIEITEGKLRALAQDLGNALQDRDSRDRRILELEAEVLRYTLEMEELQKMVLDLSMEKEVEPEEANIPSATELTPGQRAVIERLLLAEELKGTVEYLTLQNVGLQEALERLESELEIQKSTSILEVTQDSQIQHAEGASPVGGEMVMYCDGQCCSAARQLLQTHAHLDSLKMVVKDLELMAEQREHRIRQLENLAGQHSPSLPRSRSIRAKSLALGSKGPTVLSTVDEDPQAEADEERESEVTQLKQDLDAARSAIKIYETQVAELKQTLDDVERARHVPVDTIKLLHRVRTLEDWIHQKVDELAELEFELGRTRATANSLEEELEKERGDHAALRKQMDRLKRAAASAAGSQARRLRHVSTATGTSSSGVSTAVLQRKGSFSTSLLGDILPSVLFDELSDLNGAVVRYNVGKPESSSGSSDLGMHANGVSLTANDTANRNTAEVDMADDGEKNLPNYNLADLERVVAESRKRIMDLERELSELDSTNSLLRRDKMALRQLVADLEAEQRKKKQNGTKRLLMWPLRRDRETHSQAALDHS
ncbi:hypothetical protein BJ742DRAFT_356466 [Cladochytrium replicatum]|nr:hypothetical protein BJ742DRAFT_356466 [Cladochytrium replicatum]